MNAEVEFGKFMERVYPDPADRDARYADLLMAEAHRQVRGMLVEEEPLPVRKRPVRPKAPRSTTTVDLPDE